MFGFKRNPKGTPPKSDRLIPEVEIAKVYRFVVWRHGQTVFLEDGPADGGSGVIRRWPMSAAQAERLGKALLELAAEIPPDDRDGPGGS